MKKIITAISILSLFSLILFAESLEFRYVEIVPGIYQCQNDRSQEGLNRGYLGECGDVSDQKFKAVKLSTRIDALTAIKAEFNNCDFSQSYINDSHFNEASVFRTSFRGGYLYNVDFSSANLRAANFSNVNLGGGNNWKGATFNDATLLPFTEAQALRLGMIKAAR